ncbi:MAG: CoA-binding protein, partial [Nitrospinota bacterium]
KTLSGQQKEALKETGPDELSQNILKALDQMSGKGIFVECVKEASEGKPSADALLGAFWASIAWASFMKRKISRITLINLPWYSRIFSTIIGCSASEKHHQKDSFCGVKTTDLMERWSFSEVAFLSILGKRPSPTELFELNILLGLIISNGPGTISAQGCKGAVSADGPEDPGRVQINKGFLGFLTHTGFAHGGNGYEAIAFLIEHFKAEALKDPGDRKHGISLKEIADRYALSYAAYKKKEKAAGNIEYKKVPCINHPVFKGKDVNYDPRERFVHKLFEEKGTYNIFFDFYHNLVESMFENKVTKNVYCVNIDAIIAVILLKMVWSDLKEGKISDEDVESSAFTTFLYGRMVGCAAEIDDHINRGKNMDTRTPASKCAYVG